MDWRTHIARHGGRVLPGAPWVRWTLFALMLLAAALRFWRLAEIPYTHDEISGLVRTGYATFGELVRNGVAVDAHPPGVAVFLHYWTQVGGYGEGWVKSPFILVSILALFLLYRFAITWTNATVALVTLALFATIQYTVMYAQIARPYAAGFFTCALLADQWTRWLAGGPNARRALIGTSLGFGLCAYMHHFALLFAGLVALTGVLLAAPSQRRQYLVACAAAVLLYLPNMPIFLRQLGYGGVGQWLAAPDKHWIPDYVAWVMQYSWVLGLALAILVLVAVVARILHGAGKGPLSGIGLFWGLTPLVIGMAYSLWVDPVLQYSVLLFSFPFLLIALLHGLPDYPPRTVVSITILIAVLGVDGLVNGRRHYTAFYLSKYEGMLHNGLEALKDHGSDGALVLLDAPDEVVAFYLRLWQIPEAAFPHVNTRATGTTHALLDSLLRANRGRLVVYGEANGAPPEQIARIQQHFPKLVQRTDLVEGQLFRFSDDKAADPLTDMRILLVADPRTRSGGRVDIPTDMPVDSMGAWDYTGREFGVLAELAIDTVIGMPLDRLEVKAMLAGGVDARNVGLVLELVQGDSTVFYRTDELDRNAMVDDRATLIVAGHAGDARWRGGRIHMRTYLHSRDRAALKLMRLEVGLRQGNGWQYGLFQPLIDGPYTPK